MVKWLTFAHKPISFVSIFISDFLRFCKSSSFDACTKNSHTHTLSNTHISGRQIPFFRELIAYEYKTIELGGGHLRFLVKWLIFAHKPISFVSIFISDFLRFCKSSSFDACTKNSHTHTLSNTHISGRQIPFFRELIAYEYKTIELGGGHLRFLVKWLIFAHKPISFVSIFISDFLRFCKSSSFDACTKNLHTHTLSNACICGRQVLFFTELLANEYETIELVGDTFDFWSNGSLFLINQFLLFQYS